MIGLRDKLYWRIVGHPDLGRRCCFEKLPKSARSRGVVFGSLCGQRFLGRVGGQAIERPAAPLRCAGCDVQEMTMRGKDASMPATI